MQVHDSSIQQQSELGVTTGEVASATKKCVLYIYTNIYMEHEESTGIYRLTHVALPPHNPHHAPSLRAVLSTGIALRLPPGVMQQ